MYRCTIMIWFYFIISTPHVHIVWSLSRLISFPPHTYNRHYDHNYYDNNKRYCNNRNQSTCIIYKFNNKLIFSWDTLPNFLSWNLKPEIHNAKCCLSEEFSGSGEIFPLQFRLHENILRVLGNALPTTIAWDHNKT